MTTITAVPLPQGTLIAQALPQIHYADAYRAEMRAARPPDLDSLVRAVFATTPAWTVALLRLRNTLVRPFGLRPTPPTPTAAMSTISLQPGAVIGLFRVFARSDNEIILGDNDRHLDFRVGILRRVNGDRTVVTVSTIVCFHNWLGRLYFVPVRPFHRLIVPALMRRAAVRLVADTA
jgi:hypothetical protein